LVDNQPRGSPYTVNVDRDFRYPVRLHAISGVEKCFPSVLTSSVNGVLH
jgi:hypothetical protein